MKIEIEKYCCERLRNLLALSIAPQYCGDYHNNPQIDTDEISDHIKDCPECKEKLPELIKEFNTILPTLLFKIPANPFKKVKK